MRLKQSTIAAGGVRRCTVGLGRTVRRASAEGRDRNRAILFGLKFMRKRECCSQFPGKRATGYCGVVVFSAAGSMRKNNSISKGGQVVEESRRFLKR